MEVCFVILHPTDPAALLQSTAVIRWLNNQVDGSEVFSVAPANLSWLLEAQKPFYLITYKDNLLTIRSKIKELLPDYLIDLEGNNYYKPLKKRLKVLDFPLEKLSLFDVKDDQAGPFLSVPDPDPEWLPESFARGYLVLTLDGKSGEPELSEELLVRLTTLLEYPVVITGMQNERPLADEIARKAGCTVYPACGDFTPLQTASMIRGSTGLITSSLLWGQVAKAIDKQVVILGKGDLNSIQSDPRSMIEMVGPWIKH